MTSKQFGIVLLVVALICAFVAVERYQNAAEQARAANEMMGGLAKVLNGGKDIETTMPTETKYAIFLGGLSAVGGLMLMRRSR